MTYQLHTGLPDELAASVKAYAAARGITIAAAVRVLLHEALSGEPPHVTDGNPGLRAGLSPSGVGSRSVSGGGP